MRRITFHTMKFRNSYFHYMFLLLCRDWTLVQRHPCGVECVNAVWVVEQLFGIAALLSIVQVQDQQQQLQDQDKDKEKEAFADFFAFVSAAQPQLPLDSMDDLCAAHALFLAEEDRTFKIKEAQRGEGNKSDNSTSNIPEAKVMKVRSEEPSQSSKRENSVKKQKI